MVCWYCILHQICWIFLIGDVWGKIILSSVVVAVHVRRVRITRDVFLRWGRPQSDAAAVVGVGVPAGTATARPRLPYGTFTEVVEEEDEETLEGVEDAEEVLEHQPRITDREETKDPC